MDLSSIQEWNNPVGLQGKWHFSLQDPREGQVEWEEIEVPGSWEGHGAGYYELELFLPLLSENWGLLLQNTSNAYRVHINGMLVGQRGLFSPHSSRHIPDSKSLLVEFSSSQYALIQIFVSNFDHHQGGIFSEPLIGPISILRQYDQFQRSRDWFLSGVFLIFALYHLVFFLLRPQEKSLMLFGFLGLTLGIRTMIIGSRVLLDFLPLSYHWVRAVELSSWYMAVPLVYGMIQVLFPKETKKPIFIALGLSSLAVSFFTFLAPTTWGSWTIYPMMAISLVGICFSVYSLLRALKEKRENALVFLLGFLGLALAVIHDMAVSLELFYGPFLISYGVVLLTLTQGFSLLRKLNNTFKKVDEVNHRLKELNQSLFRFIPKEFLLHLKKNSLKDISLGDRVEANMTVLFADIRGFTALADRYLPEEVMDLLNRYVGGVAQEIEKHRGFVDKFVGDGLMALFPHSPSDAVLCAIDMQNRLTSLNQERDRFFPALRMGIGIHKGPMVLGTIGTEHRMDTTVVADAVNIASRLEHLCRRYGSWILISQEAFFEMEDFMDYFFRILQQVQVRGKKEPMNIIEVLHALPDPLIERYRQTEKDFQEGVISFLSKSWSLAKRSFQKVFQANPADGAAHFYLKQLNDALERNQGNRKLDYP